MSDDLSVRGGYGGVAGRTEDIYAVAGRLRALAGNLSHRGLTVGGVAFDRDLIASAVLSPGTSARVLRLIRSVEGGPHGLVTLSLDVEAHSVVLTTRAQLLRLADSAARPLELVRAAPATFGMVVRDVGFAEALFWKEVGDVAVRAQLGDWFGAYQQARSLPGDLNRDATGILEPYAIDQAQTLLTDFPASSEVLGTTVLGGVNAWRFARDESPWTLEQLVAHGQAWANADGYVIDGRVQLGPHTGWEPADVDSLKSLFVLGNQLQSTVAPRHDDSAVRITKVVHDDGSTAWIVTIPGTQEWGARAGGDPSDLTSNLALMSGHKAQLSAAVITAMVKAGIPPDDPVMLTGHSQGGIVAADLASNPSVVQQFHVTAVATAGSPIADFKIPSNIAVLSVEHEQDPVPRLDLNNNPDVANWTTVHRDVATEMRQVRPQDTQQFVPIKAHDLLLYADTVGRAETSHDPSVDRFLESAAPFLHGTDSYQDWNLHRARP